MYEDFIFANVSHYMHYIFAILEKCSLFFAHSSLRYPQMLNDLHDESEMPNLQMYKVDAECMTWAIPTYKVLAHSVILFPDLYDLNL